MDADQAAHAIVSVGKGRGFIVESGDDKRYVITAAHCLPFFPPCTGASFAQVFHAGADAYLALVEHEDVTPLTIAATANDTKGRLFSLKREWMACRIKSVEQAAPLWIFDVAGHIEGGMSGSPILAADQDTAIGVVCLSAGKGEATRHTEGGPSPRLSAHLPGWLLAELGLH